MDYQFKPLGATCAGTGRELKPGERCHCVLIERDGQMLRLDYSEEGWSGAPEGAIGEWIAVVPVKANGPKPVDAESLMRYFEQLCEDANPEHDRFRYVLALTLLQRRRLRLEDTRSDDDGSHFLKLVGSKGEGPFEIRDEQLSEDEISQLQHELNAQLEATQLPLAG